MKYMTSKVDEYASLCKSKWGSGEFGEQALKRPEPFTVLSDKTRLAIVVLLSLKGPMTTKQIAEELELAPSTVLDHLKKLKEALLIKEVEVAEKKYKRERYYDVDFVPYFIDELEKIVEKSRKFIDILAQTAIVVFEKCLDELAEFYENTLMAKHGFTLEDSEVRHFIWVSIWNALDEVLVKKEIYTPPLKSPRRHYVYLGLRRPETS